MDINLIQKFSEDILDNIETVIIGKRSILELILISLLCRGHILIEDVPGTGKTMIAKSLAKSLDSDFRRIQFTPDILPSDITGVSIYNQVTKKFEFRPGPIVAQVVLADEINRATPKAQSALLEAMEERQITVDGKTHLLPTSFIVLATQNPIEYEGTFPLPEAELDRFLLRVRIGYPSMRSEMDIMQAQQFIHPIENLKAVSSIKAMMNVQEEVKKVLVTDSIKRYIVTLINATREHDDVYLGASPRGSIGLYKVSQVFAAIQGRDYVIPDDIKYLAESVLSHRLILQPAAKLKNIDTRQVITDLLEKIPIPTSH